MSGFIKAAGNASACTTRPNTNICLSNNSIFGLQRLGDAGSSFSREGRPYNLRPGLPVVNGRQDLDEELPDGPLVNRRILTVGTRDLQDEANPSLLAMYVKEAEYLMSFPVVGEDSGARRECMKNHLAEIKETNNVAKARPVLIMISLSGIKVCCNTGEVPEQKANRGKGTPCCIVEVQDKGITPECCLVLHREGISCQGQVTMKYIAH